MRARSSAGERLLHTHPGGTLYLSAKTLLGPSDTALIMRCEKRMEGGSGATDGFSEEERTAIEASHQEKPQARPLMNVARCHKATAFNRCRSLVSLRGFENAGRP